MESPLNFTSTTQYLHLQTINFRWNNIITFCISKIDILLTLELSSQKMVSACKVQIPLKAVYINFMLMLFLTGSLALWVECSPMVREIRVQSQVSSYQRLKKWYLIPSCLTLSIIRCVSRVKWGNPRERVAPSATPRCSSYWKGSLRVALDYGRQLYFTVCVCVFSPHWKDLKMMGLQLENYDNNDDIVTFIF